MAIRKRVRIAAGGVKKVAWIADYRDRRGKRHEKQGFTTERAATDWLAEARVRGLALPLYVAKERIEPYRDAFDDVDPEPPICHITNQGTNRPHRRSTMFLDAKPAKIVPTRMQARGTRKRTTHVEGWEVVAALDVALKALGNLAKARKQQLRDGSLKIELIENGVKRGAKPLSLAPIEGDARGSAYLTKRSAESALAQDELDLVAELVASGVMTNEDGIVTGVKGFTELTQPGPTLLAVNPQYAGNQELLGRIDRAWWRVKAAVKDVPDDFIIKVVPEATTVVSDKALDNVFGLDRKAIETLLPILASTALRPIYNGKLEDAWQVIKRLIPEAQTAMNKASRRRAPRLNPKQTLKRQLQASAKA